ncbi:recombinase family protein [Streptomyces sp. NPDC048106]|uniref:recombinase family protein n=1 Tax=Streptomyces sp. NPDC048106 TaxID=3155750 RepID=UPI0034519C57
MRPRIAIARDLNNLGIPVPRDRHAQLHGRPTGGRRHGRDFERFRWTSGTPSKVLRSPSLMGHRTHSGQTVRDETGAHFAARKGYSYGDYVCRATARGDVCPAPAGVRSDRLDQYTLDCYRRATGKHATRENLLRDGVHVTVAKGRRGGSPARNTGPDTSRLFFTIGQGVGITSRKSPSPEHGPTTAPRGWPLAQPQP